MQPRASTVDSIGWRVPLPVLRFDPPASVDHGPPVVLAPHRDGIDAFMTDAATRLAATGLPTYLPDVYHGQWSDLPPRDRKARLDDDLLHADLVAVADLVDGDGYGYRPGIVGFCMGGRIAALAATALPARYRLAVSCYGGDLDRRWGEGLRTGGSPLELAGTGSGAPTEFHCGRSDTNPAPATVHAVAQALRASGTGAVVHEYDAGHAFCNHLRPEVYQPEAAELAWKRIVERLSRVD
jgi:carboxymethylenebutenolidase